MRFVRAVRKFLSGFVLGCGGTLWLFSRGGRKYPHGNIKLHWTVHHGNIKAFFLENINSNWMLSNVKRDLRTASASCWNSWEVMRFTGSVRLVNPSFSLLRVVIHAAWYYEGFTGRAQNHKKGDIQIGPLAEDRDRR